MAVLVSDSFNRANSSSTMGSTDSYNGGTAKTWIYDTGTWGISTNQAYRSGGTDGVATVDSGVSDNVSVSVTFSNYTTSGRLVWRCTDGSNYFIIQGTSVFKKVAGTFSQIGSFTATRGSGDVVKVSLSGNTHTIYINGTQVWQGTDSFNNTATKHGIGDNNGSYFDNFEIDDLSTGGTNLSVNLSDTVSTLDSLVLGKSLYRTLSDTVNIIDSLTLTRNLHLSFSDSINSTDSLVSSKSLHISLSDTIGTTDSISNRISSVISLAKTVTDTISLTDSISVVQNKYLTLMDLFSLVDTLRTGGGVMSQIIQIRRGHEANLPVLNVGEPALTTDTQKMFIGTPNGNVEIPTLLVVSSVSNLPTPSVSNQWMLAGVKGGTGVADAMYMCKKLSNDTYDWVQFV